MDPIAAKLTESLVGQGTGLSSFSSPETTYKTDQTSFSRILDNQVGVEKTATSKLMEYVDNLSGESFAKPIKAIPADGIQVNVARAAEVENQGFSRPTSFFEVIREANESSMHLDKIMEQITTANVKFTPQEMIRLQILAGAHTLGMEMVSRFADAANRAISKPWEMSIA